MAAESATLCKELSMPMVVLLHYCIKSQENTTGYMVIYCLECRDENLSDSAHFQWDEGSRMKRKRSDFMWQTRMKITFCFMAACSSQFTSATQRERGCHDRDWYFISRLLQWCMRMVLYKSWFGEGNHSKNKLATLVVVISYACFDQTDILHLSFCILVAVMLLECQEPMIGVLFHMKSPLHSFVVSN